MDKTRSPASPKMLVTALLASCVCFLLVGCSGDKNPTKNEITETTIDSGEKNDAKAEQEDSVSKVKEVVKWSHKEAKFKKYPVDNISGDFSKNNVVPSDEKLETLDYLKKSGKLWENSAGLYREDRDPSFFSKYSTDLIFKILDSDREKLPLSDHLGYELIGTWPYGGFINLDKEGNMYNAEATSIEEYLDRLESDLQYLPKFSLDADVQLEYYKNTL